ncbi:hypothetical protein D3C80_1820800 [compost metagenome]
MALQASRAAMICRASLESWVTSRYCDRYKVKRPCTTVLSRQPQVNMIRVRSFFRVARVLRKLCAWPMADVCAESFGIPIIRRMLKNAMAPAIRNGAVG